MDGYLDAEDIYNLSKDFISGNDYEKKRQAVDLVRKFDIYGTGKIGWIVYRACSKFINTELIRSE